MSRSSLGLDWKKFCKICFWNPCFICFEHLYSYLQLPFADLSFENCELHFIKTRRSNNHISYCIFVAPPSKQQNVCTIYAICTLPFVFNEDCFTFVFYSANVVWNLKKYTKLRSFRGKICWFETNVWSIKSFFDKLKLEKFSFQNQAVASFLHPPTCSAKLRFTIRLGEGQLFSCIFFNLK